MYLHGELRLHQLVWTFSQSSDPCRGQRRPLAGESRAIPETASRWGDGLCTRKARHLIRHNGNCKRPLLHAITPTSHRRLESACDIHSSLPLSPIVRFLRKAVLQGTSCCSCSHAICPAEWLGPRATLISSSRPESHLQTHLCTIAMRSCTIVA